MDWGGLIQQLPALAAFIWYSIEMQKRYQASIDKLHENYTASMEKRDVAYLAAIAKVSDDLSNHDLRVDDRIAKAKEDPPPGRG